MRTRRLGHESVEIEISNRLAGVGRFFRFLQSLLEFLFEQAGGVLLGFDGLLEDGFAATVLLTHRFRSSFHVAELWS